MKGRENNNKNRRESKHFDREILTFKNCPFIFKKLVDLSVEISRQMNEIKIKSFLHSGLLYQIWECFFMKFTSEVFSF